MKIKFIKYLRMQDVPDELNEVMDDLLLCHGTSFYTSGLFYEVGYFVKDGVEDPDYEKFDQWLIKNYNCIDGEKICIAKTTI